MKRFLFFVALATVLSAAFGQRAFAQNYFADTVWTKKTDQMDGFYMVKFSNNDSLIAGMGYQMDLFYDAKTGLEIKRIPFNSEVHFFNNDRNFIRVAASRNKLEIFDTKTFQVIDSLEHDSLAIGNFDISKDENYLISVVQGGLRLWNLNSKKIITTKIFPQEENLKKFDVDNIKFTNGMSKIIATFDKYYKNPNNPNKTIEIMYHPIFTLMTLDSIDVFNGNAAFALSHNNTKIAFKTFDPGYGVEVYDFNTKQLLWKLPINGPSLTGLEFSPDDKYLVTSEPYGWMTIWDLLNGKSIYDYKDSGYQNMNISHNGKYIVWSSGRNLFLYFARFDGESVIDKQDQHVPIIFPNPTSGIATIQFKQPIPGITNINLTDLNGHLIKLVFNGFLEVGKQSINFNTSDLAAGSYFIEVQSPHLSLVFKLIVNK